MSCISCIYPIHNDNTMAVLDELEKKAEKNEETLDSQVAIFKVLDNIEIATSVLGKRAWKNKASEHKMY